MNLEDFWLADLCATVVDS